MKQSRRHDGTRGKIRIKKRTLIRIVAGFSMVSLAFVLATLNTMAQNGSPDLNTSAYKTVEKTEEVDSEEKTELTETTSMLVTTVTEQTAETLIVAARRAAKELATTEAVKTAEAAETEPEEEPVVLSPETDENDEPEEIVEETTEEGETYDFYEEVVEDTYEETEPEYSWDGPVLTSYLGVVEGPSGKETYYNLPMQGCIDIMCDLGYDYEYSVREDGVKLYGGYVMVAADLSIRPKGTLVPTSLGMA